MTVPRIDGAETCSGSTGPFVRVKAKRLRSQADRCAGKTEV